jgi:protein gp37
MAHRFARCEGIRNGEPIITTAKGKFKGVVIPRPDRLSIPLKRRKPTVWAVWNDLFHEAVPFVFIDKVYTRMCIAHKHIFLLLTKRPAIMASMIRTVSNGLDLNIGNIYHGLTVCTQQEADEKIPTFLHVPGKKFLSIEPMLSSIFFPSICGLDFRRLPGHIIAPHGGIDAVILGGETGPGARPMHPDWVRSVRDQCAMAGVPFFFKGWGEYCQVDQLSEDAWAGYDIAGARCDEMVRCGRKAAGRRLDGREHNDLPWRSHAT